MDPDSLENEVIEPEEIKDEEKKEKTKKKKKQSKFSIWWKWPLCVLFLSLVLSFIFGFSSELILKDANLVFSIVVIVVFLVLSIIGDMIGVAATAAKVAPLRAMASRKVRGSKEAISLVKNADKVASIFADVLGDICGILSGAAGASIALILIASQTEMISVLIASSISAIIASLIIFGKAFFKKYSILHAEGIILICGKIVSIFHKQK